MTKKQKPDRLVAEPKEEGLAVFSYDGIGLALRIGDNDMGTVFEVAKEAIKKQQEKSSQEKQEDETREAISDESSERSSINDRQEEGEEVRTEGEERSSEATEPVAGDTSTGGVSS